MILGHAQRFAIEVSEPVNGLVAVRLWVGGHPFGDGAQQSVLSSLQMDAERFVSRDGHRNIPEMVRLSAGRMRRWYEEMMAEDSVDEWQSLEIDKLVDAVQLFAFAPEGLSSVRLLVVHDGSSCSVTAWDADFGETVRVVVSVGEVLRTVLSFANLGT